MGEDQRNGLRVFRFDELGELLGIGFFPLVWAIAWIFVKRSMALEAEVGEVGDKEKAAVGQ